MTELELARKLKKARENDIELRVRGLLKEMGMPVNLNGYHYMVKLICLCYEESDIYKIKITGKYGNIAKQYGKEYHAIERALRYAIEKAFLNQNNELMEIIFGYSIPVNTGIPTVRQFVYAVIEYLNIQKDLD